MFRLDIRLAGWLGWMKGGIFLKKISNLPIIVLGLLCPFPEDYIKEEKNLTCQNN